jgi:DivIVA domain-containing protein
VIWLWVVVIIVLAGGVVVVAVGRGGTMTEVYDERPDTTIASGRPITADDLKDVRFTTAVRGYRMDEVDTLLARLRADLLSRETELSEQTAPGHDAEPTADSPVPPPADEEPDEPTGPVPPTHPSLASDGADEEPR